MLIARSGRHAFDEAWLARIDTFLEQRYVASGGLPHAQPLIGHEDEVAHSSSPGAAREDGSPVGERALFRVASMTRPITSLALMMRAEEGLVALDTPVHHVLPEFDGVGVTQLSPSRLYPIRRELKSPIYSALN